MTAARKFFYESLTLNLVGTFFTDCISGGGPCAEVTVIRDSTVKQSCKNYKNILLIALCFGMYFLIKN